MLRYRTAAMSASLLALALAGCNKSSQDMAATSANSADSSSSGLPALPAALPMQTGPASQLTTAPPVAALPAPRHYVGLARPANDRQAYAYLDRAADTEDEIDDAPPDYAYDYDGGVRPWVWETSNGDYQYAEPVDGGYRYYYYQPGANYPYLVRAGDRSYAYADGALVAIYALNGALLPPEQYGQYRDQASRFFWRGQQLQQSAAQRPHQGVIAANWAARRPQFASAQSSWAAARAQQPAWQSYHAQNDPSQQPGWQQEHQQRQQVAQQFSGWQSRGLAGSPPPALAVTGPRTGSAPHQPGQFPANGRPMGNPGEPGLAAPEEGRHLGLGSQHGAGLTPNPEAQAGAAREQQLAAQREAEHQAQASQRLAQQARGAQQAASAQHEAAAKQQMVADVHRQQAMAAQEQVAGRQQAQQREAGREAHQAQLQALGAQRQEAQTRAEAPVHEHAQPAPRPEMARAPAPHAEAPVHEHAPPASRPEAARAPAPHPEAPHGEPGHHEPGHENDRHER